MVSQSPDPSSSRPSTWAIVSAFALVYVCWGTTYLALKWGVREEGWPPALFGGVRVFIAGLLIFLFQALRGQPLRLQPADRLPLVVGALLLFVFANGLLNVAGQKLESGFCAVVGATAPLWIAFFELFWPGGDRLSARGWLGLFVGLGGVAILCIPSFQNSLGDSTNIGVLCALGSATCWALGSLVGRHRRISCSHLTAACYQMLLGGAGLALVGLALGESTQLPTTITFKSPVAFAWLLVFGSLVGFVAYNWLLEHVPVAQVGTHAYVNPAIAVLIGIAVGEEMTPWLMAGIVVVLVAIALVRGGTKDRPAADG